MKRGLRVCARADCLPRHHASITSRFCFPQGKSNHAVNYQPYQAVTASSRLYSAPAFNNLWVSADPFAVAFIARERGRWVPAANRRYCCALLDAAAGHFPLEDCPHT